MITAYKPVLITLLIAGLIFRGLPVVAQSTEIVSLVRKGATFHDRGEYAKAISIYRQALLLDSSSTLVNYEMAFSFFALKEYDSAKTYCQKAMVEGASEYLPAVLVYGSVLDNTGNPDEAIKLYKKTLKKHPDDYLLHYNLAISYGRIPQRGKAQKHFELAIRNNLGHGSSHLALAEMMYDKKKKVESLLPLYFFLVIEPDTKRSQHALTLMFNQLASSDTTQANTVSASFTYNSKFGLENLLINMNPPLKKGEDEFTWFQDITRALFQTLAENYLLDPSIWRDIYVPVFADLVQSEHFDTFCYYISQSRYQKSETWVYAHPDEVDKMFTFLNN